MLKFILPLPPKTKKNHQLIKYNPRTKTRYIGQSEAYTQYERDCIVLIPGYAKQKIDYPVNVKAVYYMKEARRVDITNLHSALHDILVAAGVLKDDSSLSPKIVVGTDGSRVLIDRKNPRTEICITEVVV